MRTNTRRVSWGVVLTVIGMMAGWQVKGCNAYAAYEHRISVVETKQDSSDQRLERMENKIDRLLERVR